MTMDNYDVAGTPEHVASEKAWAAVATERAKLLSASRAECERLRGERDAATAEAVRIVKERDEARDWGVDSESHAACRAECERLRARVAELEVALRDVLDTADAAWDAGGYTLEAHMAHETAENAVTAARALLDAKGDGER